MTFNEYSEKADSTVRYIGHPLEQLNYTLVALGGEAGELLNDYKKFLRTSPSAYSVPEGDLRIHMLHELGDVLWYLTQTAKRLGSSLEQVAEMNIAKLANRYLTK